MAPGATVASRADAHAADDKRRSRQSSGAQRTVAPSGEDHSRARRQGRARHCSGASRHRRVDARAAYGRLARHPGPAWHGASPRSPRSSSARPSAGLLTTDDQLPESWLDALSVFDVGIVIGLIWSYQFDFDASAGVMIKPPAFAILLLIVGVRALRFHPRPIVVTGLAAVAGWSLLVCAATLTKVLTR